MEHNLETSDPISFSLCHIDSIESLESWKLVGPCHPGRTKLSVHISFSTTLHLSPKHEFYGIRCCVEMGDGSNGPSALSHSSLSRDWFNRTRTFLFSLLSFRVKTSHSRSLIMKLTANCFPICIMQIISQGNFVFITTCQ